MGEKRVNPRIVFLLVLLIAVGIFLLYSRLSFTGYVITSEYFNESKTLNDFSNASVFENTKFDGIDAIVLENLTLLEGVYTAPLFAAPNETEVIWSNFVPQIDFFNTYTSTSSAAFYYRACNDVNCTGADFIPINLSSTVVGKYFQYKVVMQTSGNSPKLYGVSINYRTHLNLPISIDSPQNITYKNETVLLKITANSSVSPWFYNGTGNETYFSQGNRTFSQGNYIITAWVSDTYGNVNSTSVTFSVWFLKTYYRFANNACSTVSLILPEKTANDYATLAECQSKITSSNTTSLPLTTEAIECSPSWDCGNWSECVDGTQTRDCSDASGCTTETFIPDASMVERSCTGGTVTQPEGTETTTTSTEETSKRGFLNIVGSVVTAPFTFMFGNKTRIFIFSTVLLLVIVGFLVFKFNLKAKLKILKLLNLRKRKTSGEN